MKHFFKLLYIAFISIGIVAGWACKGKTPTSGENNGQPEAKAPVDLDITVDSAQLKKFVEGFREKQELSGSIEKFYRERDYKVAWTNGRGPKKHVEAFIKRIENANADGLRAQDFRISQIKSLSEELSSEANITDADEEKIKDFDILLTTEFYRYSAQINSGITRYYKNDIGWLVKIPPAQYDSLLNVVLADDNSADPFIKVEPQHAEYKKLKQILHSYRQFAKQGGWPQLTGIAKLKMGDTSDQVVKLRERLTMTGEFATGSANFFNPKIFDRFLDLAVKEFQTMHGLDPDGVVAGKTLMALNVPVKERIQQILVNMERWRLMPKKFPPDYLLVNVPEFKLHIFEANKEVFNMRVVVGKEFNPTPVFNERLEYIVFSPYWNVPKSIAIEEVLPALTKNPNFLAKNQMEVVKGWDPKKVNIVPAWQVPWYNIENDDFDYWIRQRPGGENPLGLVKFIFPNNHNVYLHDTPNDYLFNKVRRDFSHGCIRVEYPFRLAQYLLRNKPEWTDSKIKAAMNAGEELYVNLKPLPVYILYFTSWVDADGKLQVRDDIYGRDKVLAEQIGAAS